ncbi:MAG: hypothetical protein J0I81_03745, partial [Hyphomicrobium sp.]|nr:hypothetical protein [Hyphomicrobium sp.]
DRAQRTSRARQEMKQKSCQPDQKSVKALKLGRMRVHGTGDDQNGVRSIWTEIYATADRTAQMLIIQLTRRKSAALAKDSNHS